METTGGPTVTDGENTELFKATSLSLKVFKLKSTTGISNNGFISKTFVWYPVRPNEELKGLETSMRLISANCKLSQVRTPVELEGSSSIASSAPSWSDSSYIYVYILLLPVSDQILPFEAWWLTSPRCTSGTQLLQPWPHTACHLVKIETATVLQLLLKENSMQEKNVCLGFLHSPDKIHMQCKFSL